MKVRRVRTASGATAVQIVSYRYGQRRIIEHLGSAHDPAALAALEAAAQEKIEGDQLAFDLELPQDLGSEPAGGRSRSALVLKGTRSRLLWEVLQCAYSRIFGDAVADDVFTALSVSQLRTYGRAVPSGRTRCRSELNNRSYVAEGVLDPSVSGGGRQIRGGGASGRLPVGTYGH